MSDRLDALLRMYDEHAHQARQHEDQRERMTNLILVASVALIAFISYNGLRVAESLIASIAMTILGAYGYLFSLKEYEKNRLHTTILKAFRDEIDKEVSSPRPSIGDLRSDGTVKHERDYKKRTKRTEKWLLNMRLYKLWAGLPLLVAGFGLVLSVLIIVMLIVNQ
jgi:uncharacterized membrane protein YqjE